MIIIAFSDKTSKILPNILCKNFKHCAPIIITGKRIVFWQFVSPNKIKKIQLSENHIKTLQSFGWQFVWLKNVKPCKFSHPLTCVQFVKQIVGIKKIWIQTPDALFKMFDKKRP